MADNGKQPLRVPSITSNEPLPPAYFLSLEIEKFRCFGPNQTLNLSAGNGRPAPWTILLGDNGVGKTSLLQCLAALQPERLEYGDHSQGSFPTLSSKEALNLVSPWLFSKQADARNFRFRCMATVYLGTKLSETKKGQHIAQYGAIQDIHDPNLADLYPTEENIQGLVCYGYGASRRIGKTSLSERSAFDTSTSLFSSDVELLNAEEWLLQADYAATRKAGDNRHAGERRDQIKAVLLKLLPGVEDIRIAPAQENELQTIVQVKTPYGWVRIQDLSLGYTTMLTWIVDFASRLFERYPNSENPLAEPAICLIDEIDLHLHPKWQRTIMDYLCNLFPNTQFIATAHSPLIVQAATNANIALLRREGDHVVIDNNPQSIANWRIDQVLTSDLFGLESARPPDLDKALAERRRILSKARLTKKDEARLRELEAQIGNLPTGETPEDIEAMDVIRQAAAELLNKR